MAWWGKKMIGMPFLKKCQKLVGICSSTSGDNDVINHYTFFVWPQDQFLGMESTSIVLILALIEYPQSFFLPGIVLGNKDFIVW